ncbi:hypothetical protein AAFF_G00173920 [Aldrovandia affinis]|uniref:Death domain-containing protein n=1 Tax=Aldrovandia affinis TaxID=143900 RepID=A0AAD7WVS1_9TELE|nr:hypothetical protein AAFF_G00173920 [Aldrovandia affinis]
MNGKFEATAFGTFLKSLEEEFLWVAETLKQGLVDGEKREHTPTETCRIPDETLRRVPSDRELNRLACRLGPEWESVLLDLGVSAAQVVRCRADRPHDLRGQALAGLVLWRQASGREATVQRLLQSLQAAQIHPSLLEEVFRNADYSAVAAGQQDQIICPAPAPSPSPSALFLPLLNTAARPTLQPEQHNG